jgi:hypothetical protein
MTLDLVQVALFILSWYVLITCVVVSAVTPVPVQ